MEKRSKAAEKSEEINVVYVRSIANSLQTSLDTANAVQSLTFHVDRLAAFRHNPSQSPKRFDVGVQPALHNAGNIHHNFHGMGWKTFRYCWPKTITAVCSVQLHHCSVGLCFLAQHLHPNMHGAFLGVIIAFEQATVTTYLPDVTPEMHRGSFTAMYTLLLERLHL